MVAEGVSLVRIEEIFSACLNIVADLREAGAQVLDELDQVLHCLDHLGDGQVVENLLAVAAKFSNLKKDFFLSKLKTKYRNSHL